MDIDVMESAATEPGSDRRLQRLQAAVAATIAVLATFMAVSKVKDDNIVQAMQQAQADKVDHWSYYQARNIRQELAEAAALQLRLARADKSGAAAAGYDEAIKKYDALAADQAQKKADVRAQAEQDQKNYDALNFHDDQFDLSEALLALSISLLAVASLTKQWWLYWLTLLPISFGTLMGLSGLLGWRVHPDALIRLLS